MCRVISGPGDGRAFEQEFCGCSFWDVDEHLRRGSRRNFTDCVRRVKEHQSVFNGWNPRQPRTPLAEGLHRKVASRLRGGKELRLFIAIGTVLDLKMGIDCFFEYDQQIVTIDLTVSAFKKHYNADFLLTRLNFLKDEHYHIGEMIAQRLSRVRSRF